MVWQSGENLRIDNDVLDGLNASMTMIRDVLTNAGGMARNTAAAAGDAELSAQIVDFADDWRKTRTHMLQEIDKFQGYVATVTQGFEDADKNLTSALTGGGGNIE